MNETMLITYRAFAKKRSKLRKSRRWEARNHAEELRAYTRVLAMLQANGELVEENAEFMTNWSNVLSLTDPTPPL